MCIHAVPRRCTASPLPEEQWRVFMKQERLLSAPRRASRVGPCPLLPWIGHPGVGRWKKSLDVTGKVAPKEHRCYKCIYFCKERRARVCTPTTSRLPRNTCLFPFFLQTLDGRHRVCCRFFLRRAAAALPSCSRSCGVMNEILRRLCEG